MKKIYLFSNFKGILIILVVLGHIIGSTPPVVKSLMGGNINGIIYSFHMAAFLFVSGYFSKNIEKGYSEAVKKYLIPYIFMNLFLTVIKLVLFGKSSFNLLYPDFSTWFLLTLFFYKIYLKSLLKIRNILLVSCIASILIGCVNLKLQLLAISRAVSFFPFFLLGYYFKYEWIEKIKRFPLKYYVILTIIYAGIYFIILDKGKTRKIFYFRDSYKSMHLSNFDGMLFHALTILLGIFAILLFLKFISNNETIFSIVGDRTLTIYFGHSFFYYLSLKYQFLSTGTWVDYVSIVLYTALAVFLLSRECMYNGLNKIFDITSKILLRT